MSVNPDAKLLLAIEGVKAYMIHDGNETEISPTGRGHTLEMMLVPTEVTVPLPPSATGYGPASSVTETDYYLHLRMPGLDLTLPATTPIFSMPPRSYVIPFISDVPGLFHRFEFLGSVSPEEIDTFESIMSQFTSFSLQPDTLVSEKRADGGAADSKKATMAGEKGTAVGTPGAPPPYNPADYQPGEAYAPGTGGGLGAGRLVLVDEDDGHIMGELSENAVVVEESGVKPGSKAPVEVTISANNKIKVSPLNEEFLDMARHPVYSNSSLVQSSAAASRFIVMASDQVAKMIAGGAEGLIQRTKATDAPLTFKPATHESFRKLGALTTSAASFSSRTAGQAARMAQNLGASFASKDKGKTRKGGNGEESGDISKKGASGAASIHSGTGKVGYDEHGNPVVLDDSYKPGLLNKSLIAFSTLMDGLTYGGTRILQTGATSTTQVVTHKWGAEAGAISDHLVGGIKNVALVYIDVTGVSRRAVIKSVAKGMVIGRVNNAKVVVRGPDTLSETAPVTGAGAGAGGSSGVALVGDGAGSTTASGGPGAAARNSHLDSASGLSSRTPSGRPQSRPMTPVGIPPPPPYPTAKN